MDTAIKVVKDPKAPKTPREKKTKKPNEVYASLKTAVKDFKPNASKKKVRKALKKAAKLFVAAARSKTSK